jgi:hypothetical protein
VHTKSFPHIHTSFCTCLQKYNVYFFPQKALYNIIRMNFYSMTIFFTWKILMALLNWVFFVIPNNAEYFKWFHATKLNKFSKN